MFSEKIPIKNSKKSEQLFIKGFTLLELLCVVTIIAIIIGLSTPVLTKTAASFYLRSKAKQIQALCQFIKRKSIMENRAYKLAIDFYNNSYLVFQSTSEHPNEFQEVNDFLSRPHRLPMELSFKSQSTWKDKEEILFSPSGTISSCEFLILNERKNTAKLTTTLSGEILLEFL